jgi:hypothetical protein
LDTPPRLATGKQRSEAAAHPNGPLLEGHRVSGVGFRPRPAIDQLPGSILGSRTVNRSESTMHSIPPTRPLPQHRFAIVLGSGGGRSIAALGMVEVLVREGLRPKLVVGSSAGAMIGALIAAGHKADEAVRIATAL